MKCFSGLTVWHYMVWSGIGMPNALAMKSNRTSRVNYIELGATL